MINRTYLSLNEGKTIVNVEDIAVVAAGKSGLDYDLCISFIHAPAAAIRIRYEGDVALRDADLMLLKKHLALL